MFQFLLNALIAQNKVQEAQQRLSQWQGSRPSALRSIEAYCLYKQNRFQEALQVIRAAESGDDAVFAYIEAQVLYRLGQYSESLAVYARLMSAQPPDSQAYAELYTNYMAVKSTMLLSRQHVSANAPELAAPSEMTFETMFNEACALIAKQQWRKALALLQATERLCRNTLSKDEYSAEEIAEEVAPIQLQTAYVLFRLGRSAEAAVILNALQQQK